MDPGSTQFPSISVIEDDPAVSRSLDRLLSSAGWRVATFASAEDFLAAHPGAVAGPLVLDVHLPGLSGLELDAELRARGIRVPTLFITAGDHRGARDEALRNGALGWLEKPVDPVRLLAAVEEIR